MALRTQEGIGEDPELSRRWKRSVDLRDSDQEAVTLSRVFFYVSNDQWWLTEGALRSGHCLAPDLCSHTLPLT